MKTLRTIAGAFVILLLALAAACGGGSKATVPVAGTAVSQPTPNPGSRTTAMVVKFTSDPGHRQGMTCSSDLTCVVQVPAEESIETAMERIKQEHDVELVEPVYPAIIDPLEAEEAPVF